MGMGKRFKPGTCLYMYGNTYMYLPLLLVWVACLVCGHAEGKKSETLPAYNLSCPAGQFYVSSSQRCSPCSVCSNNNVVSKPCSQTSDTVCGPFLAFKEFQFFRQDKSTKEKSDGETGSDSQVSAKKTEVHLTIYRGSNNAAERSESQHWRTVAFSLIGALSALIFVATFVVLVVWRRFNLRTTRPPAPADDDADCPYVLIHTIRPSCSSDEEVVYQVPPGPNALHQLARQRQRLFKYRPKRRLLPANEYADDVFESEDSAGSRRRTSLQAIPETGHSDTEAECSADSPRGPPSAGCQQAESSGSSVQIPSSVSAAHTESSGSSVQTRSLGSAGQMESSGSFEHAQALVSATQTESSGSSVPTQSSGSSVQTQSSGSSVQTQSSGSSVQANSSEPTTSSVGIITNSQVNLPAKTEYINLSPPVCTADSGPASPSLEAVGV